MKNAKLIKLIVLALVLGVVAYILSSDSKPSTPKLNGKVILPDLDIAAVAKIECGELALSAKDGVWTVDSYHGYPAAPAKVSENLIKLTELKVGQVSRGKKLENAKRLVLSDVNGGNVATLKLGAKHPKYGHGRYVEFQDETVLMTETLDNFDDSGKRWVETKIVDEPWISFNEIATLTNETEYGFATGVVTKVTIAGDTNRVMTIGGVVKDKTDRYIKLDNSKWVYEVSSYSVDKFLPKPPKPEEKKAEKKDK